MSNIKKPFISVILPAYNEEAILADNVHLIADYLTNLEDNFNWEIIIINDGSKDKTGIIADSLSIENDRIRVVHHLFNRNLGHALRSGFIDAKGEFRSLLKDMSDGAMAEADVEV